MCFAIEMPPPSTPDPAGAAVVLGLAMAAQDATQQVRGMLGPEHAALAKRLAKAGVEARETQKRCTALAGTFKGKKTAILEAARETKKEATEMREAYLGGEDDPLDGFEFLTMAEAGEVGHWSIVASSTRRRATRSSASSRAGRSRSSSGTSRRRSTGHSGWPRTRIPTRKRPSRRCGRSPARRRARPVRRGP